MFGFRKIWEELQKHGKHIATLNDEMGDVLKHTKHIPVMRNNIKWLTWLVCAVFLMVAGALLQRLGFLGI